MRRKEMIQNAILKNNSELDWLKNKLEKVKDQNNLSSKYASPITNRISSIIQRNEKLYSRVLAEFTKQDKLVSEFHKLKKENENVTSDNYLLQYKKKDLLVLADNLEDAYEEIAIKNKEIMLKAKELREVNEELQSQQDKIEEKTQELEIKKGELEDQADYLYDANERITSMHQEVQKQKDEIVNKNEELISLNNEKNNLIGIVAHDLKSPLNQIEGLISLIKLTADLEEEPLKFVDTINISVGRLNAMIAKILDVEAIESKKLNLKMEKVNLVKLVKTIVDNFKITAEAKGIQLINQFSVKEAFSNIDSSFANQIYENILSNAIKFSPNKKNIYINLLPVDHQWMIEIKDEGPGLSEDDKKKLFGKYQKLSAQPTGNETSTGLGLSIVKKYVEAMDGNIWCESQPKNGASFFVTFAKQE
jgi:signal transduction histidine kinase